MAIKGLTDQAKLSRDVRGRAIRLGYLNKGERDGFGKDIKLRDLDYFRFSPVDTNGTGKRMTEIFYEVYGEKPRVINDVRIPETIAANFNIESKAWLNASKHTEKGSVFLAQSDGENVLRLRNEETGRVANHIEGSLEHADITRKDKTKYGSIQYKGKWYPWQQQMQIDLILPDFNEALYREGVAGYGVVTLLTSSTYDIPTLISEYYGILDDFTALMANPLSGDYERVKNWLPLRTIPLRLYRSEDKISTPDYRNDDPGNRLNSTRWLLHWQIAPNFSSSMHKAIEQRTQQTLAAVANLPLLQSGKMSNEEIDEMFSYQDAEALPAPKPVEKYEGPELEDFDDDIDDVEDIDYEEQPENEVHHDPTFWLEQAKNAINTDALARAIYQYHLPSGVFNDATAVKRAIKSLCPNSRNEVAISTISAYAKAVADGVPVGKAKAAAKAKFEELVSN